MSKVKRKGGMKGCYECGGYFEGGGYVPFIPDPQFLEGGVAIPLPGGATEFRGRTHEEGGIYVDDNTEVEDGETMDKVHGHDYFFSNHLKLGGKTFAQRHKQLLEAGASQKQIDELGDIQEVLAGRDKYDLGGERIAYKTGGHYDKGSKVGYEEIYEYLVTTHGISETQAAGIIANIKSESAFYPGAKGDWVISDPSGQLNFKQKYVKYRNGKWVYSRYHPTKAKQEVEPELIEGINFSSGGLFQHHKSRFDGLVDRLGDNWDTDWKGQIDYAMTERSMKKFLEATENSEDVPDAVEKFMKIFERPTNQSQSAVNKRVNNLKNMPKININPESLEIISKHLDKKGLEKLLKENGMINEGYVGISDEGYPIYKPGWYPAGITDYVDYVHTQKDGKVSEKQSTAIETPVDADEETTDPRFPRRGEITGMEGFEYSPDIPDKQAEVKYGDNVIFLDDPQFVQSIENMGGFENFMDAWMENANPEVLADAGIESWQDLFDEPFEDKKGRTRYKGWGKYQQSYNKIVAKNDPNLEIQFDSAPGEQTLSTGFIHPADVNRKQEELLEKIPLIPLKPLPTDYNPQLMPYNRTISTKDPKEDPKKPPTTWNQPKKQFPWDPVLGVAAGAAQLIPAWMAFKEKPDYMHAPGRLATTHLDRVEFNDALAANAANYRGMGRFIEQSGLGPAGIANKMAAWGRKQEGDMKIEGEEARQNAAIANQEAMINQQSRLHNIKNRMYVDEFNRAADAATKDRRLMAVTNAVQTLAGMNTDRMQYKAQNRMAMAIDKVGVLDRFDDEWAFRKANPQLVPGTKGYTDALNEYRLSIADPEAYNQNQIITNEQDKVKRMGGRRRKLKRKKQIYG